MSRTESLLELFTPYNDAVEIGLLEDEPAWDRFLELAKARPGMEWGLHFPRLRVFKPMENDLVAREAEARHALATLLASDAKVVEQAGGQYVLVHFPFFTSGDCPLEHVHDQILRGLEILHQVAASVSIPIVVEFKLGRNRDPGGLRYVIELGDDLMDALAPFGCCLDVGDWSIASLTWPGAKAVFDQWLTRATHLHLHGVALLEQSRYYWTPVGDDAPLPGGWHLGEIIKAFCAYGGRWAVCEHTPHLVQSVQQVRQGYAWLRHILDR